MEGKEGSIWERGEAQVVIGEWSCVLDGRTWSRVKPEEKDGLVKQFGRAQSQKWQERTGGSYFWTYKMDVSISSSGFISSPRPRSDFRACLAASSLLPSVSISCCEQRHADSEKVDEWRRMGIRPANQKAKHNRTALPLLITLRNPTKSTKSTAKKTRPTKLSPRSPRSILEPNMSRSTLRAWPLPRRIPMWLLRCPHILHHEDKWNTGE